jgi:hypothetical protein
MTERHADREPRYFIAVFGEKYASKDPVNGGCYPVSRRFCPSTISEGDKMLLFCLKDYPGHSWEAPGIGEVTRMAVHGGNINVYYKYGLTIPPIKRRAIWNCLTPSERKQLQYPRLPTYHLREISHSSAKCIGM